MGKRRKRLTMAKYAKKYAGIRATVARLRGETVETTESIENEEILVTPNALKATTTITNEEEFLEIDEPEVEEVQVVTPDTLIAENIENIEEVKAPVAKKATAKKPKTAKNTTKTTTRKRRTKKTDTAS